MEKRQADMRGGEEARDRSEARRPSSAACLPELSVDPAFAHLPASSVAARVQEEEGLAGCVEAIC